MIDINLSNIQDINTRYAVESLRDSLNAQDVLNGSFKLYTLSTTGAVTGMDFAHTLGFVPTDVIVTRITGGTVTWSYDSFTKDKLVLSTSGPISVRFLVGRIV